MKKEKIGILGGTFNPIHTGHLILAENAYDEFHLNKVWIMPSGCSYFKDQQRIVSGEHRMQMISLAIEKNPHFELSTLEIYRPGNTYTYETIHFLKDRFLFYSWRRFLISNRNMEMSKRNIFRMYFISSLSRGARSEQPYLFPSCFCKRENSFFVQ